MTELAKQAADFIAALNPAALPPRCTDAARMGIADCVGVMIAGANERAPRIVAKLVPPSTSNDAAPEIPSGRNLAAPDAALVNGVAAHVLDYDDVALAGHPSTVLAGCAGRGLDAQLQRRGCSFGLCRRYELWALLQALEPGQLHDRGFHPTALYGTLAAAAACARLHELDRTQT